MLQLGTGEPRLLRSRSRSNPPQKKQPRRWGPLWSRGGDEAIPGRPRVSSPTSPRVLPNGLRGSGSIEMALRPFRIAELCFAF